jgi:pimeloyl-ACP methyl ester carboxylesterase
VISRGSTQNRRTAARFGALAAAGGTALAARHLRAIFADPEYRALSQPLSGRPLRAVSVDGTELYTEVFGADRAPTIVLVPGWTERLQFFDQVTRRLLDDGFRVVAYDLRGQGRSDRGHDRDYAIERYGEDLEAVLASACSGRTDVVVAGHSLGAMSIASWAAEHDVRARVRGAVLMNTGLEGLIAASRILPAVLPAALARRLATQAFLGNRMPLPPLSSPLSHAAIRYVAFGPAATFGQVAYYERMLVSCPPSVRAGAGLSMATMDLLHALTRLTVPTMVIAGAEDRLTPRSHAERIAAALPALDRLTVMPRTGHMAPLERPAELSTALGEFSRRAARATAVPVSA